MISLPQPDDLTSLVLRTDFTDEAAWEALKRALHTWEGDDSATTMTDVERPLLAVDLAHEPGRTFRVPPRWYADISANLTIANMDFAEFADAADRSGTYRGLGL